MYRSNTCGELRIENVGNKVQLAGWIQKTRDLGGMTFIDLRDRYGITQLVFNKDINADVYEKSNQLNREFVIQIQGLVAERSNKNKHIPTGDIEIIVEEVEILNTSKLPPFTIEDQTDGGEELRMKYRYLDLRRNPLKNNLVLRHKLSMGFRNFLSEQGFLEIETPYLIKSTPEGARDFVVPSRMNAGKFYALPQSPQTFKQLLMVSGYDRYFQLVKCFRDEDLRADRQPEFTQIDCEMAFVEQNDVLEIFENMIRKLFKDIKGVELGSFPKMPYEEAMKYYGNDKPDIRFGMEFHEINELTQNKGFKVFDSAELVLAINANNAAHYTRKQLDALTNFVKKPQIGAKGLVYVKCNEDGTFKSSVDKFYTQEDLAAWAKECNAEAGDLLLVMSGDVNSTRRAMSELRLEMGNQLGLRDSKKYSPLWVVDFPLLEWDEENERYHAMHHPFTAPKPEEEHMIETSPEKVHANAYDMVINGVEIGGGSIRIHKREMQSKMFKALGFTPEEAKEQFGFLLDAFEYGAPPHGGIALGFDRLAAMFGGTESIRDYIAFPKNNRGQDLMIESPSSIDSKQLDELSLKVVESEKE